MKFCPNCRKIYSDNDNNCAECGCALQDVPAQAASAAAPSYDHTAEFDPRDISDNKVLAMLPYLTGFIGIIIALLAGNTSPYTRFHMIQALKIQVCTALSSLLAIIPILGWIAVGVCAVISIVLNLIGFFTVCAGKAEEPAIVRNFKFLK